VTGVVVRIDRERVWLATADADDTQARVRANHGAAATWVDGAHYFFSGIVDGPYNRAHVVDVSTFNPVDAADWFGQHNTGLAVRALKNSPVTGRRVRTNVLMAVGPDDLRHGTGYVPARRAIDADITGVINVDAAAFGPSENPKALEQWIRGHVGSDDIVTTVVEAMGTPVATGYVVLADGTAGRTAQIGGIAVVPMLKRRGLGAGLTTWLADYAFEHGADLVHLYTDTDEARRLYTRLGFEEAGVFEVIVDVQPELASSQPRSGLQYE